jgi:hypothetical protein
MQFVEAVPQQVLQFAAQLMIAAEVSGIRS